VGIEINPGPGERLDEKARWRVIFYKEDMNLNPTDIAKKVGTTRSTVYNTVKTYEETGTVHDKPRRGRKRIYSESEEKKIVSKAKKKKKAPQIASEMGEKSSVRTIQRILKKKGLFYGKVKKIEKLTATNKKNRVAYAKEMRKQNWRNILFSDEKTFQLGAGEEYAWQEPGDREVKEYVLHAPKLNVWGAIGAYIKTPLYFFEENMDSELYQGVLKQRIKEKHLIYAPDAPKKLSNKWEFLQDGATAHTAKASMEVIRELIGNRLHKHPAKSPDLNPIEDMWSYLDRKVKESKITTILSLKRKLRQEWKNLPWTEIRKSVDSMRRRLRSCEECGGNRLDY
jgi:transposase